MIFRFVTIFIKIDTISYFSKFTADSVRKKIIMCRWETISMWLPRPQTSKWFIYRLISFRNKFSRTVIPLSPISILRIPSVPFWFRRLLLMSISFSYYYFISSSFMQRIFPVNYYENIENTFSIYMYKNNEKLTSFAIVEAWSTFPKDLSLWFTYKLAL